VRIGVYVDGFNLYYGAGPVRPWHAGLAVARLARHWWARLSCTDLKNHQLPDPMGLYHRPPGW
jgi:hypothetical protein